MIEEAQGESVKAWLPILIPTVVEVLFYLLRLRLPPPTAGGLAFLFAALLTYWLFPKTRLTTAKIIAAGALALIVALLMWMLLPRGV